MIGKIVSHLRAGIGKICSHLAGKGSLVVVAPVADTPAITGAFQEPGIDGDPYPAGERGPGTAKAFHDLIFGGVARSAVCIHPAYSQILQEAFNATGEVAVPDRTLPLGFL